jgi:hypothetical protein
MSIGKREEPQDALIIRRYVRLRHSFGLTGLWMDATTGFTDRRNDPVQIEPLLRPMCCPCFLKSAGLLGRGEAEAAKRQNHRANADVGLPALANMATLWTLKHCGANVPLRPDSLQHRVQFIAQFDEPVEGHARMPLGAQPLNHLPKPHSLRVARGHAATIVLQLWRTAAVGPWRFLLEIALPTINLRG